MGDDIDISDLPAPPPAAADVDISDLPTPPPAESAGTQHFKKAAQVAIKHPFTAMAGLAENALAGAAGGVTDLTNVVTGHVEPDDPDRYVPAKWTQPHTEAGKEIAALGGEESANLGTQYDKLPGADTPLGQTIKRYGPEAFGAVSTAVPLIKGAGAVAGRIGSSAVEAGHISDFGGHNTPGATAPSPTPAPEGPITAEALRAQPDPLAPAAPAEPAAGPANVPPETNAAPAPPARVPVPGKPHIRLKPTVNPAPEPVAEPATGSATPAPAPVEPPRFTPPTAEGASVGELPAEAQASRMETLHRLNDLAGGQLGEVRTSALSGNSGETGQDWAHAKVQDVGGKRMQEVIGNETNALRAAADKLVERTGTVTDGVDQPALNRRGTIISKAISGIEDFFDNRIKSLYETAKARARGTPIDDMSSLKALANDKSSFYGTTEGEALYRGVQARAQALGLMGEDGAFKPATIEQAEQFRQYLGEQWTPRTAALINKLKDAVDSDVARHGGSDLFQQARSMRAQKGKMLEDPTGIAKLLHPDDRLGINRAVPLNEVPDYVANLDPEQFHHVVNVLKSAAHLGEGELAEPAAAALREIKGHMAAKLNEAGSARIQGGWDAKGLYKQLNDYSLKMPSVFSPGEIADWKTVNDASNVLRMDKTYKGAVVEAHNAGFGRRLREKAGHLTRGGIDAGAHVVAGPFGPAIAEVTGLSEKIGKFVGGDSEKIAAAQRLAEVEKRVTKLENPRQAPAQANGPATATRPLTTALGQPILSGKQRGAVGVLNRVERQAGTEKGGGNREATVNVGLNISDKQGLTPAQVKKVLESQGVKVTKTSMHQSDTEPTLVASLDKPLTPKQANTVSALLKQDAIAQVVGDKGELHGPKAKEWGPFNRDYFLTHSGERLSANDQLHFKHFSDLTDSKVTLDPKYYGKGLTGAERMRIAGGAPKVTSAYGMNGEVEKELQNKTPYRISVPKREMYDLSADPKGFKQSVMDENNGVYDHSEVERQIRDAGYTGYHLPTGQGIFEGQARFFKPVEAQRMDAAPASDDTHVKVGDERHVPLTSILTHDKSFREAAADNAKGRGPKTTGPVEVHKLDDGRLLLTDGQHRFAAAVKRGDKTIPIKVVSQGYSDYYATPRAGEEYRAPARPVGPPRQRGGALSRQPMLPTEHLTPEERGQLRADTAQRLIDAFHKDLPPPEEYAAAALAGKAKKGWYENSARAIANTFGPDAPRFAALLASMSPQTSVQMNFHNALRTFINWDKAGRPQSPAAIKSIMEESSLKSDKAREGGSNVLQAWVPNAIRALTHPDPENLALSGPKVHSFMRNLQGDVNEVTNDAWMAAFAKMDPAAIGGKGGVPGNKRPAYMAMSAKVRAAAKMLTQLTGETWTPREVQETVWSWAKTATEQADSYGAMATIPELVKDGEISDELIKATPDFHQLFSAPEHSGVLGNSRYAENVGTLAGEPSSSGPQGGTGEKAAAAERTLQPHLLKAAKRLEAVRASRQEAH